MNLTQNLVILALSVLVTLVPHIPGQHGGRQHSVQKPTRFYIGGVLSSTAMARAFTMEAQEIDYKKLYLPQNVSLYDSTQIMDSNPIKTAIVVCNKLIREQVYAIIVSKPENGELSPASVSYTAGFYHIPVIGISSRDSAFSDKVEKVEEFEPGQRSYKEILESLKSCQARVYFLYASKQDADTIFQEAAALNMTGHGYAWIVTEQALYSSFIPHGALGLNLTSSNDEEAHIHDSLHILASAIKTLYDKEEDVEEAPSNCNSSGSIWETGKKLFNYIRGQTFEGRTGNVAFDGMGDRLFAEYQVINIQKDHNGKTPNHVIVGNYKYTNDTNKMVLSINDDKIVWPGGSKDKPSGVMIPTHLKVLTIVERPFIYIRNKTFGVSCEEGSEGEGWVECPEHLDSPGVGGSFCCRGYCMDLLEELSRTSNFTYSLHVSLKGDYGNLERNNDTGKQEWTGLIGELVGERADLIMAPLTINPERAQVMEFSKPFKYQGITILQKKQPRASQLVSFLQPFKYTLWILVLVSVKVIAICLYLLDRFSPFGRYNADPNEIKEEESLNLTSAIWFAWGVLLNSGIGEGTPRSFSARVLGMVWAGFAMIIVASYTANLAAFLVLDKPQTSLTGINDPRLRNPVENFTYATVKGSAVDMYFRRQVELSNMYRTMEGTHFKNPELAIEAVLNGSLKAFIWDSSRLEFEAARDCDLITAGELFGRSGYGVGLQKGSPWADKITLAILDYHESGLMEDLDNKWILNATSINQDCREKDGNNPVTLGLENMRGVFILVGAGIVGGIGLIIVEILYHKHKMRRAKRTETAKVAFTRWKGTIEKRKTQRQETVGGQNNRLTQKPNGFGGSRSTTLALSIDSLPSKTIGKSCTVSMSGQAQVTISSGDHWSQRPGQGHGVMRPRSSLNIAERDGEESESPGGGFSHSPHSLRSLPSAEFLRMLGTEDTKLHSPITPLSFDFDKKKRSKQQLLKRCNSPDILNRSSHDLVSRPERMRASEENLRSPRYSEPEGDYAPVSTERWIIRDSQEVPEPPPPPRRRAPSSARPASPGAGDRGHTASRASRDHRDPNPRDLREREHSPNCIRRAPQIRHRRNSMHYVEDDIIV